MKFAEFLRITRKSKNLSLYRLSKISRISYGYLYRLEEGSHQQPSPEILKKLADALDVDYDILMDVIGYLPATETQIDPSAASAPYQIPVMPLSLIPELIDLSPPIPRHLSSEWIPTLVKGPRVVGLRLSESHWQPLLQSGDLLIVDMDATPAEQDVVITLFQKMVQLSIKTED